MNLKYKLEQKKKNLSYSLQYWLIKKIFKVLNIDILEDYCIDIELLYDYYNEEPDYEDYRNDLD